MVQPQNSSARRTTLFGHRWMKFDQLEGGRFFLGDEVQKGQGGVRKSRGRLRDSLIKATPPHHHHHHLYFGQRLRQQWRPGRPCRMLMSLTFTAAAAGIITQLQRSGLTPHKEVEGGGGVASDQRKAELRSKNDGQCGPGGAALFCLLAEKKGVHPFRPSI